MDIGDERQVLPRMDRYNVTLGTLVVTMTIGESLCQRASNQSDKEVSSIVDFREA